jgi:hypothetical protein
MLPSWIFDPKPTSIRIAEHIETAPMEQNGATTFLDDESKLVSSSTYMNAKTLDSTTLESTETNFIQDIKTFLAKPYRLADLALDSTAFAPSVPTFSYIVKYAGFPTLWKDKMRGFYSIRFDYRVRLVINGTKFQAGRYILAFIPHGGSLGVAPAMRHRSLMALTQLPHVEFDVNCDTDVVFDIPWTSPVNSMLLYDAQAYANGAADLTFGKIVLFPYSPVASNEGGASEKVLVTVFHSLHNVELRGTAWTGQSGLPISEKEEAANTGKPISSGLLQLSRAASSFSNIPLLTPFLKPASWFLAASSGAARAFGFSKPLATVAPVRNTVLQQPGIANADGVDTSDSLALYSDNFVTAPPGFSGKDVDEMSIKYIASIPAYYTTLTWNAYTGSGSTVAGTNLATIKLEPNTFSATVSTAGYTYYDHVPFAYISQFFRYWRGDIALRFKFVKTQFHSGRLEILWNPFFQGSNTDEFRTQLHRDVIDIRECNEYTVVFPFTSNLQMRDAWDGYESGDQPADAGAMFLNITTPLVAPATAPQSVQIIVEAFAVDYEVAAPGYRQSTMNSVIGQPIPMPFVLNTWVGQSGLSTVPEEVACSIHPPKYIGTTSPSSRTLDYAKYSTGEAVLSILPLLKRYSELTWIGTYRWVMFKLYDLGFICDTDTNQTYINYGDKSCAFGDYYSFFAPMYAYSSGSLRALGLINNGDLSTNKGFVETTMYNIGYGNTNLAASGRTFIFSSLATNDLVYYPLPCQAMALRNQPGANPVSSVQAPPYALTSSRLNRVTSSFNGAPVDRFAPNVAVRFRLSNKEGSDQSPYTLRILRSAADDFRFGLFLGTPAIGWSKATV